MDLLEINEEITGAKSSPLFITRSIVWVTELLFVSIAVNVNESVKDPKS